MYFIRHGNALRKVYFSALIFLVGGLPFNLQAQTEIAVNKLNEEKQVAGAVITESVKPLVVSVLPNYYNQTEGITLAEIVRRAFENNGDIKIARLEVERARLTQAGLRANPTLEVEQTSGRLVGSSGNGALSVGVAIPIDVYNQRRRRIDLATAEITLREAEITARQRVLASQIFVNYSDRASTR
jgi:outer membrane protein TolC